MTLNRRHRNESEFGRVEEDILCSVYLRGRLTEQFKMRRTIFLRIFAQWAGEMRGDLNYPEFPDSWGELFDNLE